jgi:hypothetical protein
MYVNEAGNLYEVNEIMYFISDVRLHKSDGSVQLIEDWKDIHYVDIEIPSTLTWNVYDEIEEGTYDSITFVFGISEIKNQSFMFVDFPEVNMMWPEQLGGGYHYMMINGRWLSERQVVEAFNFHLGIGQLYKGGIFHTDSIYEYVHNHFTVSLPGSAFVMEPGVTREIEIAMHVDSWFKTPHEFDFNYWGGAIMQVQDAMHIGCQNGYDVFEVRAIK